jgi:hypothetical protein
MQTALPVSAKAITSGPLGSVRSTATISLTQREGILRTAAAANHSLRFT